MRVTNDNSAKEIDSKSVRVGGFRSVENYYPNGDVTPRIYSYFQNKIRAQSSTVFSIRIFLYFIDIHMVKAFVFANLLAISFVRGLFRNFRACYKVSTPYLHSTQLLPHA